VLIVLLMLRGIVVTNAIVLRDLPVVTTAIVLLDLAQHKIEVSADVRTAPNQGDRPHVRPILMTAAATILALIPQADQRQRPPRPAWPR
jgi:multidrug efflux pump subunit AcrB